MHFLLNSFPSWDVLPSLNFTVNPVLFLLPMKLQLHLCLDSIILFLNAFCLLLLRKRFTAFYSIMTFMIAFSALFFAIYVNLASQDTLLDLISITKTQTFYLFWDAFEINSRILRLKLWFFLGNIFLLLFLYGGFKQTSEKENLYFTLPLMILFLSAIGSLVLSATNLLTLLLCIETFSFLGLYIIRFSSNKMSAEASLLYFFMNLLATGFLSLGFLLIYIGTGEYTLSNISDYIIAYNTQSEMLSINSNISLGLGLILGTFLFKIAAFPCFFWMPLTFKAMSFAGIAITSYTIKYVNVCLLVNLSYLVLPSYLLSSSNAFWILICAFGSIVVGTFLALNEFNFRKFLAFTSVNQMGYILLGFLAFASNSSEALDSILYFIFIYFLSSLLFLSSLASIRINNLSLNTLSDLRVLYQQNPRNLWFCLLAVFTMAGLPPTTGFWAKYYIIRNCWDAGLLLNWDADFIIVLQLTLGAIVFMNFFSAIYYIRLIIMLIFTPINITWDAFTKPFTFFPSVISRFWAACNNTESPNFSKGIRDVVVVQWGTVPALLKQNANEYLNIEFVVQSLQVSCAIFLIFDFINRLF